MCFTNTLSLAVLFAVIVSIDAGRTRHGMVQLSDEL